jgi:hypothetical protein
MLTKIISSLFTKSADAKGDTFSNKKAITLLALLSNDDEKALAIANNVFSGTFVDDEGVYVVDEYNIAYSAIVIALTETKRLASLDWAEELDSCSEEFGELFGVFGLDPTKSQADIAKLDEPSRGEAVAQAYIAFRESAGHVGMRIVGLNDGSDMYQFALAPELAIKDWTSVRIGVDYYLEDSDWQFKKALEAQGIEPRSTKHPSRTQRPSP